MLVPASVDSALALEAGAGHHAERARRTNLLLAARLTGPGEAEQTVKVRNLSLSGARVETQAPPEVGSQVRLSRGSLEAEAVVAWSDAEAASCGLRFLQPLPVGLWLEPERAARSVRRKAPEPDLSADLGLAGRLVDYLSDVLLSRPVLLEAFAAEAQALDLLAQLLKAVEARAGHKPAPSLAGLRDAARTLLMRR